MIVPQEATGSMLRIDRIITENIYKFTYNWEIETPAELSDYENQVHLQIVRLLPNQGLGLACSDLSSTHVPLQVTMMHSPCQQWSCLQGFVLA